MSKIRSDDVTSQTIRVCSDEYDTHPIIPTLIITHISEEQFSDNGLRNGRPQLNTLTMMPVTASPVDLAKAFLTFVSQETTSFTEEELRQVTAVIAQIHQRWFLQFR